MELKAAGRAQGPQFYRKQVGRPQGRAGAGDVVRVVDRAGKFVGQAFYNPRSEITLRLLTRSRQPVVDEAWIRAAVQRAVALRRDVLLLDKATDAWRVIYSEADHLPGLVVDRFGPVLSCQVASLGVYRQFATIVDELRTLLSPEVVHVSADPAVARKEGFPLPDGAGDAARTIIREHKLKFEVDCAGGHKTGFFLDQRESRRRIRSLAAGRRVLDLFCYTGGFSLNAARGGALSVTGVDLDEDAVAQARRNEALNDLPIPTRFVHADAFDVLRQTKPGVHDLMIVDPAKQSHGRADKERALRYYADLNALAFEKAPRGGLVLTCSCTGVVGEWEFIRALQDAAGRAGRELTVLEVTGAPADHPVPLDFPAARYLNSVLVRVD